MSLPSQTNAPRRGGGMFFLLVFAVIAFVVFSRNATTPPGDEPGDATPNQSVEIDLFPNPPLDGKEFSPAANQPSSDWGQEDVAVQKNPNGQSRQDQTSPSQSRTQNGDWAQEDVNSKKDNGFQFSTNDNKGTSEKSPKQSQSSDWGQEDVKSDSKSTPNSKPKKTQNGDWGQEDVDPKKGNG